MSVATPAAPDSTVAASARNAVKVYGSGDTEVRALDGVTVDFTTGRFTAIMGPSGSGKSTLMHCTAGLDELTSGEVSIGGTDLSNLNDKSLTEVRRDHVGFVFQSFNLIPTLNAIENITLPMDLAGRKPDKEWLDSVVSTVGLGNRLNHRPSELSGGQQQRVAVARALASQPKIIFADEPTGNLDSRAGAEILGFIQGAVREMGQTVVMVSHDPVAAAYSDRVLFLTDGKIVGEMERPTAKSVIDRMKGLGLMFKLTRRSLWEHKRRLILTLVAIMLGVGFMAGTFVLSDTMDRAFDDLFAEGSEKVDAQVQGEVLFSDPFSGMGDQRRLIDASVLDDVRAVDGVAEAEPFVIAIGFGATNRVLGTDGEAIGATQGPPTLIENWYDNDNLSVYDLTEGRGPESDDEIALNVAAVDEGGFEIGGPVTVLTQFGPKTYTLVGQFLFGTAKSSAGAISADFTLPEAQRLAGTNGQIQQVVAKAEPGISQQELVDRIRPVLPDGAEVITGVEAGEQLSSDVQSGFAFFQIFLSIFGGVALLVGVFVISNTFSILVAQRSRELALLRAVGARRGQILRSVLVEAIMVGLIGAGLGLAFGLLLAWGVTAAFASFGAELPTEGLALRAATVITALLIGVIVTLVASLGPAIRSTRVPPIAALRDVAFERTGPSRTRIAIGLAALALGAFNLTAGWRGGSDTEDVPIVGFGGLLLVAAAIVVGPVLTGPTIRILGRFVPRLGVHGRLGVENAARSPKRTSATASALIIGMALVGLIGIFSSSAEASITKEVGRGFEGDFAVTAGGGFTGPSPFPPVIADEVAKIPGVEAAVGLGFGRAEFTLESGKTIGQFLSAVDPAELEGVLDPRMTEGEVTDLTDDGIIVDIGEAQDHGISIGDTIAITFAGGKTRDLEVEAISDEENLLGYYTISRATFLADQQQPQDFMVFGKSEPGSDLDEVMGRIEQAIADVPTLKVVDRDGFIGSIADSITAFVNVINVLLVLSVIIATIGIANTLSLAIHERTREMGLLRAVGMNRKQLRSSIRWEAILISVLGTAVGFVLAVVVSRCLLQALHSSGLIAYRIPVGTVVSLAIVSIVVGVIAAFFPSRAARMAILDAIAKS